MCVAGAAVFLVFVGVISIASCEYTPPATKAVAIDMSADMQAKRKEFIDDSIRSGVFQKVDKPGDVVHAWVTPAFMALSFDDKKGFLSVVCAYYDGALVRLRDSQTGNDVGSFDTQSGLIMD